MPDPRAALGAQGESLTATHLEQRGFSIIGRNVRVGRLELDLLALRDGLLVICEVRTRASRTQVEPVDTIDRRKRERVRRAAELWIHAHGYADHEIRFDAASVVIGPGEPSLSYYEDAF